MIVLYFPHYRRELYTHTLHVCLLVTCLFQCFWLPQRFRLASIWITYYCLSNKNLLFYHVRVRVWGYTQTDTSIDTASRTQHIFGVIVVTHFAAWGMYGYWVIIIVFSKYCRFSHLLNWVFMLMFRANNNIVCVCSSHINSFSVPFPCTIIILCNNLKWYADLCGINDDVKVSKPTRS